jgi:hypothetical protein
LYDLVLDRDSPASRHVTELPAPEDQMEDEEDQIEDEPVGDVKKRVTEFNFVGIPSF